VASPTVASPTVASPTVIHVIAEQATIDGASGEPGSMVEIDGLIPPELVAELAKSAKLVPLIHSGDAPSECGLHPSRALADFVRCRDLMSVPQVRQARGGLRSGPYDPRIATAVRRTHRT
jgi:Domain of unknown function (DUF222)